MPRFTLSNNEVVLCSRFTATTNATGHAVQEKCIFYGAFVRLDGSNAVTIRIQDGSGGADLLPGGTVTVPASPLIRMWACGVNPGVPCENGIYVTVGGNGQTDYIIQYDK